MLKVFILDSAAAPYGTEASIETEVLRDTAEVHLRHLHRDIDFDGEGGDADALIIWRFRTVTSHLLARAAKVQSIVRNGIGFDNVDIAAAAALGIPVANVPDYATEEVADHSIALALALVRQIRPLTRHVAEGGWDWSAGQGARRLRELTFGIVGCGRIGTATALRAKALGFRVRFYDPYVPPGIEKALGIERCASLRDLLESAEVVSLHVPLTAETRFLIDTPQFEAMQPGAWLVNTARGPVVRQEALMDALESGKLAGAGLDVLEKEPAGALDLLAFPNVLVTPHAAFYSAESLDEVRRTSAGMIRETLRSGAVRHVVNGITAARRS
ncbi:MAG: C-terminal binding protein [Bryobacteraceae bacterium]|nr:C-terminal binding protein [Bryobacteraceae bacterium]